MKRILSLTLLLTLPLTALAAPETNVGPQFWTVAVWDPMTLPPLPPLPPLTTDH